MWYPCVVGTKMEETDNSETFSTTYKVWWSLRNDLRFRVIRISHALKSLFSLRDTRNLSAIHGSVFDLICRTKSPNNYEWQPSKSNNINYLNNKIKINLHKRDESSFYVTCSVH